MRNFKECRLGNILRVKSGRNQKAIECKKGKYQILGTGGEIGRTNSFLYDKPSVLIGRKGTIDRPLYKDEPFWTVDTLFYTEINDKALPKYIYYLFLTINWKKYNEASGVPSLTASAIERIRIKLPDLETQQKIVEILDIFGEIIETLQALVEKEENRVRSLKYVLFFQKSQNCAPYALKDLFNFKNGYTPSKDKEEYWQGGNIPWFRMEDIRKNGRKLHDSIQHVTAEAIKGRPFPRNSIIMSTTATIGEYAWIITESIANQQFTYLSRKKNLSEIINIEYFYHYCLILSEWCKRNVNSGGLLAVDVKAFMNYTIKLPDIKMQKNIAQALTMQEEKIRLYRRKAELIKDQYKYLLSHLIFGDFDLSKIKLKKKESIK